MNALKCVCGLICVAIVASNLWTMSRWSERRGVSDDLCYLRQAHLFQKSGLQGLHTDLALDSDGYFKKLLAEAGHPEWDNVDATVCHITMPASGQRVLQYPPGVGAALAMFGEGHQVVAMYAAATIVVLLMALVAIGVAQSRAAIAGAAAFGMMALYFMINPAKASYSIAPTMAICAAAGFLTARLFQLPESRTRLLLTTLLGLLLGLSVTFRIPNLFLCAGYGGVFLIAFVATRSWHSLLQGALFGVSCLIGLAPVLIANAINAGSPLATTYGGQDVSKPDFTFSITRAYLGDLQGILSMAAIAWVAALLLRHRTRALWPVAAITAINLVVNLGYFLSHPVFTPYYLMPLAMLSLWCLLFAYVLDDRERNTPWMRAATSS